MSVFKTRSELRLEELEGLRRPLTKAESAELRRVLHAIYMRNWRIEQSVTGARGDLLDVQKRATVEANAIAYRMESADDEDWPLPPTYDSWQEQARDGSDMLRDAILRLQGKLAA